jgi:hypothetical protein
VEKLKKFVKNPWVLGIGTTVIGGILLSFVLDWIKGVDWLSTLQIVVTFIFNTIVAFLMFELKVWWILIAIALIVVALIIVAKVYDTKPKSSFLSYTKDTVLGYTWEWEYKKTYDGKYTICNLHPVCSDCGMRLKQSGVYGGHMDCLRCNASYEWDDSYLTDAQMLIEDNIKKKYIQNQ